MFKQTTVAVDGEEGGLSSIDGIPMSMDSTNEESSGEEKSSCASVGQSSPRPGPTISFSLRKNTSSPTPSAGSQASKVSVSFSFAKKTPVKLDTAAAVFADHGEEAVDEEEMQEETEEKAGGEMGTASCTESPQSVVGGCGGVNVSGEEEQPQAEDGGSLASTLNKLKMMMKKEEGYSGQEPQYYHYMPPAHCRVKPHFQFLLFMKASDQCSSPEEEDENDEEEQKAQIENEDVQEETKDEVCQSEKETVKESVMEQGSNSVSSSEVKTEDVSEGPTEVLEKSLVEPSGSTSQAIESKQEESKPLETSATNLPTGPFFPVLSKDESKTLQWPSELLDFTKAQPSLSYSCNPLYFDFKSSRNKNRIGKASKPSNSKPSEGQSSKTKAVTGEAATALIPADNKEDSSSREKMPDHENKDKKMENAEDGATGSKKKKKKKKHKKSGKRKKEKEKAAVEGGEGETEMPGEKSKKKKKHKRKKNKNKDGPEADKTSGESKEKDKEGKSGASAEGNVALEVGRRKRVYNKVSQKVESSTAKTNNSEEHNGTKRLKSDPGTAAASCSASAQKSPAGGRPPSSESEEDGGSSSQRARNTHRRSPSGRERRHHSEDSGRSGRSHSRGDRDHRRNRGQKSRTRSYSSSSERSSAASSAYSRRSYSSYSDYSETEHRSSKRPSSDSEYERRSGGRSHRRHYSSSSSEEESRSRSRSHGRRKHRRRRRQRSSSRSYSRSSRTSSERSYRRSSYSRSRSSRSRSSSSTKALHRHSHSRREDGSARRRDFNRGRIYRSQSPRSSSSSSRTQPRNATQATKGSTAGGSDYRNAVTARQLLERIQSRKCGEDSGTGSKPGNKLKDPPQGYFGPKLPPVLGSKGMLPLFGKMQAGKKPSLHSLLRLDDGERLGHGKDSDSSNEVILVEPIREFPPPPPPPPLAAQKQQPKVEEPVSNSVSEENTNQTLEPQEINESCPGFDQDSTNVLIPYQADPGQDPNNPIMDGCLMGANMSQQTAMHAYPGYPMATMDEEDMMGMEGEEDGLAPLESQPITFTPEEMEKYSKLQQAAQQHIQQQLLAKQVKAFPSAAAAAAVVNLAAANLAPAPPPPPTALQQIHIQQPTVSAASATSITTVQHAILQHHAAAMGIHAHNPHHPHPAQLAQVHHIPQHHLTPISLSPLGHTLGHSLGHSLGHTGLIPAHPSAFLSGQPIHIIPASALHHAPLALHHVPHAALYPTLFAPRPAAAAAAALQLHPLLHPIFSGQDLQHPPNHGS